MTHDLFCQCLDLISHPGKTLHVDWWDIFGMKLFRDPYFDNESGRDFQQVIDRDLRAKRNDFLCHNFDFSRSLGDFDLFLLKSLPDLEKLITLAGLILMECPDYLYVKEYRTSLSKIFTSEQLNQLHVFWAGGCNKPSFDCESFLNAAFSIGMNAINVELQDSNVWPLVLLTLPATQLVIPFPEKNILHKIRKMERFL